MTVTTCLFRTSFALALVAVGCSKQAAPNCCDDASAGPALAVAPPAASASGATSATEPDWSRKLRGTFAFAKRGSSAFLSMSGTVTLTSSTLSKDGKWCVFVGVLEMKTGEPGRQRWAEVKAVTADGFERKGWINGASTISDLPDPGRKIDLKVSIPNEAIRTIEFVNGIPLKLDFNAGEWSVASANAP